jgi:archaea-specific DNA-binding protein
MTEEQATQENTGAIQAETKQENEANPGTTEEQASKESTESTKDSSSSKANEAEKSAAETSKESNRLSSEKDNVVFVGNKHLMNYVNSIEMQFKNSPEVIIKARGKFISKAVDIAEVAKRRYQEENVSIKDIKIGTEEYENEGRKVNVSTIDITLSR